jgi:mono/diheme cytochrome c family protein
MIEFLMTGKNPDGMKAMPPMPAFRMSRHDARAVALYLRSLPGKKKR